MSASANRRPEDVIIQPIISSRTFTGIANAMADQWADQ